MRTPRPSARSTPKPGRGFGTLIGNGWLRESPRNVIPRGWDIRSRSALRKCMLLELPPELAARASELPPPLPSPIAAWQPQRAEAPIAVRPRNPARDVRMFPAVASDRARAEDHAAPRAWWEDPLALGALLIVAPPIGLACVWSSSRYTNDARWALTLMSVLVTCFAGAAGLALLFAL